MQKAFVDTRIIIRLLIKDSEQKYKNVVKLLSGAKGNGIALYLLPVAILETVFVHEKVYKLDKKSVAERIAALMNTPDIIIELEGVFLKAIKSYQYALDAHTGREKWKHFVGLDPNSAANPGVRSSCQYEDGRIYFATGLAKVHCLEVETGREVWQTQVDPDPARNQTQILCSTVLYNGKVYIGTSSTQAQAVCLDAETGAVVAALANAGKLGPIEWSPDGRTLAILSGADINDPQVGRLLVAPSGGGALRDVLPGYKGHVAAVTWVGPESKMLQGMLGQLRMIFVQLMKK